MHPRNTIRTGFAAGVLVFGAIGAAGCGATRHRLDSAEPWQYATHAAEHPPANIEVVKPRLAEKPIPEELPAALRERVTLRSEAIDIRSLLLGLAKQTGLNIVLEPDVTGQVSAYFNDAPVIDVLRNIGDQLNAEVEVRGGSVSVHRPRHEFRTFRLHYLRTPRAGVTNIGIFDRASTTLAGSPQTQTQMAVSAMSAANSPGGIIVPTPPTGGGSVTQIVSLFASNFWEDLGEELQAIVFDGISDKDLIRKNMKYAGLAASDASGRSLVVDSMSGTIQVRARRPILDAIGDYLEAVDRTIQRQVVIDVKVLEVSLTDGQVFGIEGANVPFLPSSLLGKDGAISKYFGQTGYTGSVISPSSGGSGSTTVLTRTTSPLPGSTGANGSAFLANVKSGYTTPLGFPDPNIGISDSNPVATPSEGVYAFSLFDQFSGYGGNSFPFRLILEMLSKLGDVKVVTAPRLTALHNQKAVLKVVRDHVYYLVKPGTYTPGTATTPALVTAGEVTPYVVPEGVVLDVTPLVDDNGAVTMEIHPSFSAVIGEKIAPGNAGSQPEMERREFQTTVRVEGEQTVVLGGLLTERTTRVETGIPFLKDIPVIGNLFRTTTDGHQKSEIILLLTPRVQGAKLLREYVDEFRAIEGQPPMKDPDEKSDGKGSASK